MGAPKQKWTQQEEAALRSGVEKHGLGKWRAIQKDPEFAFCLATRSNVDLKDKWRNMNGGLVGHLKPVKYAIAKTRDECVSPMPSVTISGESSMEDSDSALDALIAVDSPKSLDSRYTDIIVDAVSQLTSAGGCNSTQIASFIEAHHLVPDNFRRLLKSKLREMVNQGKLFKEKQNYTLNIVQPGSQSQGYPNNIRWMREVVRDGAIDTPTGSDCDLIEKKPRLDFDITRVKLKTAIEAGRAAALAVAEAEAAYIAAAKAVDEAETAEAEAEAAEIAAEIAVLASRPHRKGKVKMVSFLQLAVGARNEINKFYLAYCYK